MRGTLGSLLEAFIICYKYYVNHQKVFYLLVAGGLMGFYQNEMLNACHITSTFIQWAGYPIVRRSQLKTFGIQYQWWLFDMVQRTIHVTDTDDVLEIPYHTDNTNIFDMCYLSSNTGKMEANCLLQSMLEAYYFQDVQGLPLDKIKIGLEMDSKIEESKITQKSLRSLRNDNFSPEARHTLEGRMVTHFSSRIEQNNGSEKKFRSIRRFPQCGPRNLNFAEHSTYIAQTFLYSQFHVMTRRLRNIKNNMTVFKSNSYAETQIQAYNAYAATHLQAVLFLLMRSSMELTNLDVLRQEYVSNAERDAQSFKLAQPSQNVMCRLFKTFFMNIDDDLADIMMSATC
jgi:hypothetical protein